MTQTATIEQTTIQPTHVTEEVKPQAPTARHLIRPMDNPHIWVPGKGMGAQDIIDIARVRRLEVKALCGFVFIPVMCGTETVGLETCDTCLVIAARLRAEDSE